MISPEAWGVFLAYLRLAVHREGQRAICNRWPLPPLVAAEMRFRCRTEE